MNQDNKNSSVPEQNLQQPNPQIQPYSTITMPSTSHYGPSGNYSANNELRSFPLNPSQSTGFRNNYLHHQNPTIHSPMPMNHGYGGMQFAPCPSNVPFNGTPDGHMNFNQCYGHRSFSHRNNSCIPVAHINSVPTMPMGMTLPMMQTCEGFNGQYPPQSYIEPGFYVDPQLTKRFDINCHKEVPERRSSKK